MKRAPRGRSFFNRVGRPYFTVTFCGGAGGVLAAADVYSYAPISGVLRVIPSRSIDELRVELPVLIAGDVDVSAIE